MLPLLLAVVAPPAVDFNRDVRPILSGRCFACHGPDEAARKGGLRLDTRDGATEAAVVPGKPGESELIRRLTAEPGEVMPPPKSGPPLPKAEADVLARWVKQGATYAVHWSYVPPQQVPPPGPGHPVDAFLRAELWKAGLDFRPEADRPTLVRRLALDLTGLPPSPDEVAAVAADRRPDWYERAVASFLAKPGYGEHWARLWLDLARYADSAGYADDVARTIWPYRDWVIQAFDRNQPFDEFTVEQLAGDLLPKPTTSQMVATAFHRNTMTNNEGGTSDEEFRTAAVVDRVNTTLAVWMGTSLACAQCHTHKYDPITQAEYFQLFAVFNTTQDADRRDEAPTLALTSPHAPAAGGGLLAGAERLKPSASVPVMREQTGNRRVTRLMHRGNHLDLGDVVKPGSPAAFPPMTGTDRLALARWLVSRDNPLTPRVTANRFWEQLFGAGLVRTAEEFGTQGDRPTHPELLDWLAVEFRDHLKWDVKRLLTLLVTSRAYRQDGVVTPQALAADPDNKLLGRAARKRLPAEAVRDQALAVGGLLSGKRFGPPVRPPQPAFGLTAAFGRSMDWKPSPGEDRHRRAVYTEWRRTNPYPSLVTFDAPSRETCSLRRVRTNTPLQALVTLNDPVFVEAAQGLGRRMAAGGLDLGFEVVLARPPTPAERDRLTTLHESARRQLAADPKRAAAVATDPIGPAPAGADLADLAAWAVVGNVLLNLDETLMPR
jgi:hypothetical protein